MFWGGEGEYENQGAREFLNRIQKFLKTPFGRRFIMRLELGIIKIKDIQFGEETIIEDGILYVDKNGLIALALQDDRLSEADVELARPGEDVRIIPVKDVIEPRVKVSGSGELFPGMIGKMGTVGSGRTNVLRGVALTTVGRIIGCQEGFIDMTGAGAE